jgi:hypothetical protein
MRSTGVADGVMDMVELRVDEGVLVRMGEGEAVLLLVLDAVVLDVTVGVPVPETVLVIVAVLVRVTDGLHISHVRFACAVIPTGFNLSQV